MNKVVANAQEALADIVADHQTLAVGGFGLCGIPEALIDALKIPVSLVSPVFPIMQVWIILVWANCCRPSRSKK